MALFDDLVGDGEHIRWDGQTESSRGLQVDHQLEFGWLLYRKFRGLGSLKYLVYVTGRPTEHARNARAVSHEAPRPGKVAVFINGRNAASQSEVKNPVSMPICKCFGSYNQGFRSLLGKGSEARLQSIEIARAGVEKGNLQLLGGLGSFAHPQRHPRIRRIPQYG